MIVFYLCTSMRAGERAVSPSHRSESLASTLYDRVLVVHVCVASERASEQASKRASGRVMVAQVIAHSLAHSLACLRALWMIVFY